MVHSIIAQLIPRPATRVGNLPSVAGRRAGTPLRHMLIAVWLGACLVVVPGAPSLSQAGGGQIQIPLDPLAGDEADGLQAQLAAERAATAQRRGSDTGPQGALRGLISPLRPIEAQGRPSGSAIRFDGESRDLDFALFLPDPGAAQLLRVATLSSINVLPERSQFRVYVNEHLVGAGRLEHFTDFGTADFELPAGVAVQGVNRVRIRLSQHHRIYCGPEASFALWSDIDLARSGAVLDGTYAEPGQDSFLMGLALAAALGNGVEIRGSAGLGDQRDGWVALITERLARAMGGDPVPFRFADYWGVQGPVPVAARVTFLPASTSAVNFRTGGDGAQVMVVHYVPGQPPSDLPEFDTLLAPLERPARPMLIATQRPVRLAEFGFRPAEIRDRYALIERHFRLPDDYVVLTNAKAEIRLDYIYADDLPQGAMLLVHVNGTNIRLLPLRGEGGQLIEDFPLRFEARLLRAGANTLGFEVMIPGAPADLPCPVWEQPVLGIGSSSTINVPYSPSMYLPDMHFAFSSLGPQGLLTNELTGRAFSGDDVVTLRAALAASAPAEGGQSPVRMHLMAFDDLGAVPTGPYAISRQAIEATLFGDDEPAPAGAMQPPVAWLTTTSGRDSPSMISEGWAWVIGAARATVQWLHPRSGGQLDQWLHAQRGQAVILQLDPARPEQLWMIRAPGSDIGAIAAAVVAGRVQGTGPRGQVAVLGRDGRWASWVAPDRQPVLLERVTPGNLRYVLGNYVSAMPVRYVVVLFVLAFLSALVALRLVVSTREH
ncbi:MAG: cellulose biosynthesis cyclic di-GMP-binding regulatory protein BcsB [Pararhodobacter sp.]